MSFDTKYVREKFATHPEFKSEEVLRNACDEIDALRSQVKDLEGRLAGLVDLIKTVQQFKDIDFEQGGLLDKLAAAHDREVEARAEKRIWLKMAEYCRKERRDICGDRPECTIGDAYKIGRHDGMGALMSYCEAKSQEKQ
jgi:hypothetical protein